jgi:excisionase family DNA binding protein
MDKPSAVAVAEPEAGVIKQVEVMTMENAAEFLCVSVRTLERYVQEGSIPVVRLPGNGKRCISRFLRSELVKWLRQRQVRPVRWKGHGETL